MGIRYPRRPNRAQAEGRTDGVVHPNPKRPDPQIVRGQKNVRFSYEPQNNNLSNSEDYIFQSPEDGYIEIDTADATMQEYVVPSSGGSYGQHTLSKYFIDPVNKILVVYHFNHQDNKWIKTTTRLRKDLPIPRPPVGQFNHNAQQVYASRGSRYQIDREEFQRVERRRYISNRLWSGRSGRSGAHGRPGRA